MNMYHRVPQKSTSFARKNALHGASGLCLCFGFLFDPQKKTIPPPQLPNRSPRGRTDLLGKIREGRVGKERHMTQKLVTNLRFWHHDLTWHHG